MTPPKIYRLDRSVRDSFVEAGMDAARKRRTDGDSAVKAFVDKFNFPQEIDSALTLLRFEAFLEGWKSTIAFQQSAEKDE